MINRYNFYKNYRAKFGRLNQSQVEGLNFLLDKLDASKVFNLATEYAYILATIKHECSDTYHPITEYGGEKYLKSKPYYPYFGRGYVQLTWKVNYKIMGDLLKLPLVESPKIANDPEVAWQVLEIGMKQGLFTNRKLGEFVNENKTDYVNARRVINGVDRKNLIAQYARDFETCIDFTETQYTQADIDNLLA